MSAENIAQALKAIEEDPDLKRRFLNSKSLQELADVIAASGYQINLDPEGLGAMSEQSLARLLEEEDEEISRNKKLIGE